MHVLHNFFGFNISTTAFCLGRSSFHFLPLNSSMPKLVLLTALIMMKIAIILLNRRYLSFQLLMNVIYAVRISASAGTAWGRSGTKISLQSVKSRLDWMLKQINNFANWFNWTLSVWPDVKMFFNLLTVYKNENFYKKPNIFATVGSKFCQILNRP